MSNKRITLNDFSFEFSGYGHYKVTYTSPVTLKKWTATTNNMQVIDNTKNADDTPKLCDLNTLKNICKSNPLT